MLCLEIYFKIELKDSLVDMLLERGLDDFFYTRCSKYASRDLLQSVSEQVSGRQDFGAFTLFLESAEIAESLISQVRSEFPRELVYMCRSENVTLA